MVKALNNKTIVVIQARTDSKRLSNKIFLKVTEKSIIDMLITRKYPFPVIVATTDRKEDDKLAEYVTNKGVNVYRGSYKNIVKRLYEAAKGYDYIIRITGDDVLTNAEIMEKTWQETTKLNADYGYQPDLIRGLDSEVIKVSALKYILDNYDCSEVESIEHYFKSDAFKVYEYPTPKELSSKETGLSLTIDTQSDLDLVKMLPFIKVETIGDLGKFDLLKSKTPIISVYCVFDSYPMAWLEEAIKSLSIQDCKYEFVFVAYNNPFNPEIITLLEKYNLFNNKFSSFYYQPKLKTFIEAITFAIDKCSGTYVLRLDADDYFTRDNALSLMLDSIKNNAVLISNFEDEDGDWDNLQLTCQALIEKKKYQFIKYVDGQSFRDGISLFETFKKYKFKVKKIEDVLFFHRKHDCSLTSVDTTEIDTYIIDCISGVKNEKGS